MSELYKFQNEVNLDSDKAGHDAIVSIIMGSQSDWGTMRKACEVIDKFDIPWECRIISAHRTPERLDHYANNAHGRGIKVIIAGAGGAAHLPGTVAAKTLLPVQGVPIQSRALSGKDSLLSIVQMPAGVPTSTHAIGEAGAINAALQTVRILSLDNEDIARKHCDYVINQTDSVSFKPMD